MSKRNAQPPTRRRILKALPAATLLLHPALRAQGEGSNGGSRLLIGTAGRGSEGIYVAYLGADGALTNAVLGAAAATPSFLAVPRSGNIVFACTEPEHRHSQASSFSVPATGKQLAHIADAESGSHGGCHVSCTHDGRCVFVANYGGGSVSSFAADDAGRLLAASEISFSVPGGGPETHGPDKDRQSQSYAHSARPSPEENYVFVSDLGRDRIYILKMDRATAKLVPAGEFKARPGSGPRHLAYHSNGKWVYSINELNSSIDLLDWDAGAGTLTLRSIFGTLPHHVDPVGKRACEMVFSPDERFLYASNRVYEDFAVFAVNGQTGVLTNVQHLPNPGKESRHMAISPEGKYLLSANQFSDDVAVYSRDAETGKLTASTQSIKLGGPSCLVFA